MLRHELDCPDIVEAVRQLDEHNANVIIECEEDALEILSLHALLHSLVLVVEHRLDLCKTFHESGDLVAEQAPEVVYSIVSVFNHIMKKGGDD